MKNFQGERKQEEEVTSRNQFDALIVKPIVIGYWSKVNLNKFGTGILNSNWDWIAQSIYQRFPNLFHMNVKWVLL